MTPDHFTTVREARDSSSSPASKGVVKREPSSSPKLQTVNNFPDMYTSQVPAPDWEILDPAEVLSSMQEGSWSGTSNTTVYRSSPKKYPNSQMSEASSRDSL